MWKQPHTVSWELLLPLGGKCQIKCLVLLAAFKTRASGTPRDWLTPAVVAVLR